MEKDSELVRGKREKIKSLSFEAKRESSDDDTLMSGTHDHAVEIQLIGSSMADQNMEEADSDLESMPDDDISSISRNDNIVSDVIAQQLPDLLTTTLKDTLSHAFTNAIKDTLPTFKKQIQNDIKKNMHKVVLKHLYKDFNALNKLESKRYVILQKQLIKSIKKTMAKAVKKNASRQIGEVNGLLRQSAKHHMQMIKYIEQIMHSTVKVPKDIMVINAQHLRTKVEMTAANLHELVRLVFQLVQIVDSVAPPISVATKGEKESQAQA
nr:hypothetical protein [Tanacetum cinerariifolium]